MMYVIDEQPDVFADAAASDDNSQLLFMSVFGRDTSIQQLLARCQLPREDAGTAASAVTATGESPCARRSSRAARGVSASRLPKRLRPVASSAS